MSDECEDDDIQVSESMPLLVSPPDVNRFNSPGSKELRMTQDDKEEDTTIREERFKLAT